MKIKKTLLFIAIAILLFSNIVFAQDVYDKPLQVIPKSPEAAALDQYINAPVSSATGVPDISIPVYTIKMKGLDIPISLSYHASGIKVDDIATPVGLKWTLNAGGMISRNILGLPDERDGWFKLKKKYLESCMDDVLKGFYTDDKDPAPDIFSYSFLNKQGNFFFDKDSTLLKTLLDEVKIKPSSYVEGMKFIARDERGNTYFFEDCESTRSISKQIQRDATGVTSWRISKIVTPANDSVIFKYEPYKYSVGGEGIFSSYTNTINTPHSLIPYPNAGLYGSSNVTTYSTILLDEIVTRNQKISFEYEEDLDLSIMQMKLKEIVVSDLEKNDTLLTVKLIHDKYPGDPRLKLTGIEFIGDGSEINKKKYEFNYNGSSLEPYGSYKRDIFGYFNSNTVFHMIPINRGSLKNGFTYPPANREIDENKVKRGLLTEMIFPTGGKVKYTYAANKNIISTDTLYAPGVRAEMVEHFDADGTLVKKNEYEYHGLAGSDIHKPGKYALHFTTMVGGIPTRAYSIYRFTSSPMQSLQTSLQFFNGFCYTDVTIKNVGNEGVFSIKEKFFNYKDNFNTKPVLTSREYFDKDSVKLRKSVFKYETHRIVLDSIGYTLADSYVFTGLYEDCENNNFCSLTYQCPDPTTHYQKLTPLWYSSQPFLKTKEITIDYFYNNNQVDSVYAEADFEYNENTLVSKITTSTSGEKKKVQSTKYVTDYELSGVPWMDTMEAGHMIGLPIDTRTYLQEEQQEKLISGTQVKYNGCGQPTDIYKFESGETDILFSPTNPHTFSHKMTYAYDQTTNNLYKVAPDDNINRVYVWGYNDQYPILKAENITYAQLETAVNASLDSYATIKELLDAIGNMTTSAQQQAWKTFINNFKAHANMQDKLFTAYTYKPLVGMTSQTDANGYTTYYEYDAFGRLEYVKDHNGKILKKNVYHYAGQTN